MKHLGDITAIDWSKVEPVDVVTGGSPCQDLSVAGKRAGLAGERSGLYMEQIRCVKELREADVRRGRTGQFIRPRYMVWENVPGAFSSGKPKGADFAAVIEEIIKVAEPDAYVCVMPPSSGWTKSGCYYDCDGRWSIAWRVHDAQFWGVPQRRKRISLVADFGGLSAPEILFERKGLRWDSESSGAQREGAAPTTGSGAESAIIVYAGENVTSPTNKANPMPGDPCHTLGTDTRNWLVEVCENHSQDSRYKRLGDVSETVSAKYGTGGNNQPIVVETVLYEPMSLREENWTEREVKNALRAGESKSSHVVAQPTFCIEGNGQRESHRGDGYIESDTMYTLNTAERHAVCARHTVRRLTPLECERLQGYPDGWTDIGEWVDSKGKRHKEADSPRYKALGNSIALPFWKWLLKRISAQYERDATLGSLFDGIGGFPLCWEQINGKGTARWASEIEEFPIAVTKIRFPEE